MRRLIVILTSIFTLSGCVTDVRKEFIKEVASFSNYDSVNWQTTIKDFYDVLDWNRDVCSQFYAECPDFPEFEASVDYGSLRAAQKAFHHKLQPLRDVASEVEVKALDRAEAMFDTVWVRYLRQDYYEDLIRETYNEVMKPAIDELVEELNNDY